MWQYTPYTVSLGLVAVLCGLLAVVSWRRRPVPGASAFALVMLGATIFSAAYAVEWASVSLSGKMAATFAQYVGIVLVPGSWAVFVLQYPGSDRRVGGRVLIWLALEPVLTLIMVITNDWHHVFYTRVWPDFVGPYAGLGLEHGFGFYVHAFYSYGLLVVGNVWLVRSLWRSASVYRGQAIALLLAASAPWLAGMTYIFELSPWPRLDLTPFGLAVTGIAAGWAFRQAHFLDIVPVARKAIFENMTDGMIALDSLGRVAYANSAARHFADLIGAEIETLLPKAEAHSEIHIGTGASRRSLDVRRSPLRDPRGQVRGQLVSLSDVSARKAAERALRDSEARYRSIVETTAEGVWVLGPDASTSFVNQRMAEMLGYSIAEVLGRPMIAFVPESERPALSRALLQGLDRRAPASRDLRFLRKDGSDVWAIVNGATVFDSQGHFAGLIGLLTDITERKRLEDELRERREHLAELVGERTAALQAANERLLQEIAERESAEARMRASLAEKDVLLKEIHHRVKNNLQVISSLLYLQSKDLGASPALERFADSQHRVRSMALVHERLYQSADLAHVDFAGYVQSLMAYLVRAYSASQRPESGGTGAALQTRVGGAVRLLVDVPGDVRLGLDQAIPCGLIINELVSNALKHAFPDPDTMAEIAIGLQVAENDGLALCVRDNGVGFPPDFDFSAPASLGLQLVRTLAHQLGGDVELARGAGTEVRVTLARPHARPS